MAKNTWLAGDNLTRTFMNQPFWIASGVYNAGQTRLEVQISPGSFRYPYSRSVVYSGQPQQVLINNPAANTYLNLYMRSDGSFIVSGTTTATVASPPRWDAEYLGMIYTGNPIGTGVLGPWNQATFDRYEQRGQYTAVTAGRMRAVTRGSAYSGASVGTLKANVQTNSATASGIAYLNFNAGTDIASGTLLYGQVTWVASGALSGSPSALYITPQFAFRQARSASNLNGMFQHTYYYTSAQDPNDTSTRGGAQLATATLVALDPSPVATADFQGYQLMAWFNTTNSNQLTDSTAGISVIEITALAIPGYTLSQNTEPA